MSTRGHDDFELALLASAKSDAMPADKKRALAAALSGATALGVAGTAKATTTVAAAAAAKKGGAGLALAKWIAAGAVGTALVAGATKGATHVYERSHASPVTLSTSEARSRAPAPAPAPTVVEPPAEPEPEPAPVVEIAPPPPVAAPPVRRAAPARPIAEELAVIERARVALSNGDVGAAEKALAEHDRDFKGGAFRDEARVLRIDVLAKKGDRAGAAAAARSYLATSPDTPYAPRVRAYVGEGSAP